MTSPVPTLHPFDQAIALELQPDGHWLGHTSPAYANMVGPYGGITAAQMLNAVLLHPKRLGDGEAGLVHAPHRVNIPMLGRPIPLARNGH
jgi:hypothetical protein